MPEQVAGGHDDTIAWIVSETQGKDQTNISGLETVSAAGSLVLRVPGHLFVIVDESLMDLLKEFPLEGN
jgi:hypothetical protein